MILNTPVYIPLGFTQVHPHLFFEFLAYAIGARLYFWMRPPSPLTRNPQLGARTETEKSGFFTNKKGQAVVGTTDKLFCDEKRPEFSVESPFSGSAAPGVRRSAPNRDPTGDFGLTRKQSWAIASGALTGALLGSVLLALLMDPRQWVIGKSIVGGLLGGVAGVELAKKAIGYRLSTGDGFVFPLLVGMILGRVGCFLSGLADNTYGIPTGLPWGVDFGDGVLRHPTALYEIAFLLIIGGYLRKTASRPRQSGDLFKIFMVGYLAFRFVIDFLKPYPRPFLGLGMLQLAALAGLYYYATDVRRLFGRDKTPYA